MRIGIDLMGGDSSPSILFEAVLLAAERYGPLCAFTVFATVQVVQELSCLYRDKIALLKPSSINFYACGDSISMGDAPLAALKSKPRASLLIGINSLKHKHIDGLVSAGNTGALVAAATLSLPRIVQINRPALLAMLPTKKGSLAIVDVGGNLSSRAALLLQFAQMGIAYSRCCRQGHVPIVGLLNIGAESIKGSKELQKAYEWLQKSSLASKVLGKEGAFDFIGNVEGREVFNGDIDVLVTDGFTGNVFLKTVEGTAAFILEALQAFDLTKDLSIKEMCKSFNYTEHPGAVLCGVDGVIVKCHGNATAKALLHSITGIVELIERDFLLKMKTSLKALKTNISF